MAVIQEFAVTPNGTVSVTACPRFTITATGSISVSRVLRA